MIAADIAAYIGQQVCVRPRRGVKAEIARLDVDRFAHRRNEGRPPKLGDRKPEQQMMHRRVAADGDLDDVHRRGQNRVAQVPGETGDRRDGGSLQFTSA